jgi:hypothetical protein
MNLRAVFQASFISQMRVLSAQSAVLNLMNPMKGTNNSESNSSLPSLADEQTGIAEDSRTVPSFLHLIQGQPLAVLGYAVMARVERITRQKRHELITAKPGALSQGDADVIH